MLELTLALCGTIVVLFIILLISILFKWKRARLITGAIMSITSVISMALFIYVQKANGNPDAGMEFIQFYFPILVFTFFIAAGLLSSVKAIRRR